MRLFFKVEIPATNYYLPFEVSDEEFEEEGYIEALTKEAVSSFTHLEEDYIKDNITYRSGSVEEHLLAK